MTFFFFFFELPPRFFVENPTERLPSSVRPLPRRPPVPPVPFTSPHVTLVLYTYLYPPANAGTVRGRYLEIWAPHTCFGLFDRQP